MITPTCPNCGHPVAGDDVHVGNDLAYCRTCNLSHKLSVLTHGDALREVDVSNPPPGTWQRNDGTEVVIGATHRSMGAAAVTLGVALFWNGIVSIFVALALSSTLKLLGLPVPEWFPNPIMNDSPMGAGITIFLWLFLTPFILIGLAMIGAFLSSVAGRTEVRVTPTEASVFSGIGAVGRRRRFDPSEVKEVRLNDDKWRDSDGDRRSKTEIVIEGPSGKPIRFGSALREDRRSFVAAAVRRVLER